MTNGEVQQLQLSTGEVEEVERKQEEVQELHLTDDLADSLMNPPTEPEQSDEEPNICAHVEMKTETEEVLLEDQEVQGITEAVEELAKNKVSQESSQLSEEVEVIRESSPLLTSSHIEDKVSSTKASPMPETLVMEDEHCEKTERATLAADVVEKETILQETQLMEVDTVKEETVVEEIVKEEEVAQTTVGDNDADAPKGKQQQGRGPRNNRQGGKRTWEKERKKEKKMEEKRVAADKSEEAPKTTTSLTELPKKSYR